jgi:hypothetical protein
LGRQLTERKLPSPPYNHYNNVLLGGLTVGFLIWLEASSLADWVRMSTLGYPMMITLHAFGMAIMVGLALLLDMRLLGRFAGIPYPALQRFLSLAWIGFGINFVSGSCLFAAQATSYITDVVYMSKMALVVLGAITAAILQNHVNHDSAKWDVATPPLAVRSIAVVSMVFWVSAIILGRLTAYLDITFSQLFGIS